MSLLDWFGFAPSRVSVLRAEARRLRREARWSAKTSYYDNKPDARRAAVAKLLESADEVDAEADAEAARTGVAL